MYTVSAFASHIHGMLASKDAPETVLETSGAVHASAAGSNSDESHPADNSVLAYQFL